MRTALAVSLLFLATASTTAGAQTVRPSDDAVPENLLRFSIRFDEPPAEPVLPRLTLQRDDGTPIVAPFLEQELWTPDGLTLTVLMHPGRVKTGLDANEELGRALTAGATVMLLLDGNILKQWRVTAADHSPPHPENWAVDVPRAGTHDAIKVRLGEPVEALAAHLIAVRAPDGTRLNGTGHLRSEESVWTFRPSQPWSEGRYAVVAAPMLEDPAGNRPGLAFEHTPGTEPEILQGPTFLVSARAASRN